ncbi:MAG TPA: VOC family protein [Nevskiaceae bacterium]|nr:VOC family protein [Nevskiaceae bacterium]
MLKQLNPYIHFHRDCAEAIAFYERVLGGKVEMMMKVKDAPPSAQMKPSKENENLVLHVRLSVGSYQILASDWISDQPFQPMHGFSLSLEYPTVDEARKVYDALSVGAREIRMPLQGTFWAKAFAMFVDQYGTPWMISGAMQ